MSEFVATRWEFDKFRIERTTSLKIKEAFAIREGLNCMNKDGEFEYEPKYSWCHDEDFYSRCRFASFEDALAFFQSHNPFENKG